MKKRKRKNSGRSEKKKFARKLVLVILIIIFFLLLARGIFYILEKISKPGEDVGLEGELGTLIWDWFGSNVSLDLLNYSLINSNQTINITINWSSGEQNILTQLWFMFDNMEEGCNYTTTNLPVFGVEQAYEIDIGDTDCSANNFTNISDISQIYLVGEVNIPLRQISLIENISFYKDDSRTGLIDLNNYFSCLEDINYSVVENPTNNNIEINVSSESVDIESLDSLWFGFQKFELTAVCGGDTLDVSSEGENMTFYIIVLNETKPVNLSNEPPIFLDEDCATFTFYKNTNYTMDMDDCFEDDDGPEPLEFRYSNVSSNVSIVEKTGDRLMFVPDWDYVGRGHFFIWANDSINETRSDKIYVDVIESTTTNTTNTTNTTGTNTTNTTTPKITSSTQGDNFELTSTESKTFSVTAEDYDTIEWYLNDRVVKINSEEYIASNLSEGNYTLKVELKKGDKVVSKIWDFSVEEAESPSSAPWIFFAAIVAVLVILILFVGLIIFKIMMERKEKARPIAQRTRKIIRKYPPLSRSFSR